MMIVNINRKQKGFTLIEIMISLLLGLIVIGGALSIYISTIRSSTDITNSARLNYDLDSVMQLMVNDIRRAGFWGGAVSGSSARNNPTTCDEGNPFSCGTTNIIVSKKAGEADNSCILYTYDADSSGINTPLNVTDDVDLDEFFGFRLNGDGIDIRFSVDNTTDLDCDSGNWENIVDTTKIQITALSFSISNYKCLNTSTNEPYDGSCALAFAAAVGTVGKLSANDEAAETRQIDITLSGNVSSDTPVRKNLTGIVKVRNDRIFTQQP